MTDTERQEALRLAAQGVMDCFSGSDLTMEGTKWKLKAHPDAFNAALDRLNAALRASAPDEGTRTVAKLREALQKLLNLYTILDDEGTVYGERHEVTIARRVLAASAPDGCICIDEGESGCPVHDVRAASAPSPAAAARYPSGQASAAEIQEWARRAAQGEVEP